jgi:hypothetical protein
MSEATETESDAREARFRWASNDAIVINARHRVRAWRNDDGELPIPSNEFGNELGYALDILLQYVRESGR